MGGVRHKLFNSFTPSYRKTEVDEGPHFLCIVNKTQGSTGTGSPICLECKQIPTVHRICPQGLSRPTFSVDLGHQEYWETTHLKVGPTALVHVPGTTQTPVLDLLIANAPTKTSLPGPSAEDFYSSSHPHS